MKPPSPENLGEIYSAADLPPVFLWQAGLRGIIPSDFIGTLSPEIWVSRIKNKRLYLTQKISRQTASTPTERKHKMKSIHYTCIGAWRFGGLYFFVNRFLSLMMILNRFLHHIISKGYSLWTTDQWAWTWRHLPSFQLYTEVVFHPSIGLPSVIVAFQWKVRIAVLP